MIDEVSDEVSDEVPVVPAVAANSRRPVAGGRLPRVGFGTAPLASVYWGNDEPTARAAVQTALEMGVRFFDTAPFYGLGESETRLGAVLRDWDGEPVTIATKVGRLLQRSAGASEAVFDFSYDAAMRSLESSLDRLGVDRVSICGVHDPDDHIGAALDGALRALLDLRSQGVIDAVSVGTNTVGTGSAFLDHGGIDCMLVAGRYTLLDQSAAALIARCAAREVAYIAAGVFNSGILAAPSDGAWYDYWPAPPDVLERARNVEAVCARRGVALPHAAMAFCARNRGVASTVIGMSTPHEVAGNLRALRTPVPEALWQDLTGAGMLPQ